MASVLEMLTGKLGGDTLGQISRQLGANPQQTSAATGAALSALLGALSRNAAQPQGAEALHRALQKDHDGSVLNDLGGLLNNPAAGPGDGILKHVLGDRRAAVEQGVGRASGLDAGSVGKLLTLLAPMVLGALGQAQRGQGLDSTALAGLLGQERQQMNQAQPKAMGMLDRLLDTDGDGDVDISDLAKHGSGLLGKLFNR